MGLIDWLLSFLIPDEEPKRDQAPVPPASAEDPRFGDGTSSTNRTPGKTPTPGEPTTPWWSPDGVDAVEPVQPPRPPLATDTI